MERCFSVWPKLAVLCGACLLAVLVSALLASCDSRKQQAVALDKGIVIKRRVIDFGQVLTPDVLTEQVLFENQSKTIARLIDTRASCSCAVGKLKPEVIQPGNQAVIDLTLEVRQAGVYQHSVFFSFDVDGQRAHKSVRLKVKACSPFEVSPRRIEVDFDRRKTDGFCQEGVLLIRRAGDYVESASSSITAAQTIIGSEQDDDAGVRQVPWTFRLPGNLSGGVLSGDLTFICVAAGKREHISVPISGAVRGNLRVSEPVLHLGVIEAGDASPREVWLESADGQSFRVTRAESDLEWLKVTADPDRTDSGHRLLVGLARSLPTRTTKLDGEIRVHTDLPGAERWRIPAKGFVVVADTSGSAR